MHILATNRDFVEEHKMLPKSRLGGQAIVMMCIVITIVFYAAIVESARGAAAARAIGRWA